MMRNVSERPSHGSNVLLLLFCLLHLLLVVNQSMRRVELRRYLPLPLIGLVAYTSW